MNKRTYVKAIVHCERTSHGYARALLTFNIHGLGKIVFVLTHG